MEIQCGLLPVFLKWKLHIISFCITANGNIRENMNLWRFKVPAFIMLWLIHLFIFRLVFQQGISDNYFLAFLLGYIPALLGLTATLLVSAWITGLSIKQVFMWMGRNTIVILCTHMIFHDFLLFLNVPYISSFPFIYIAIIILSYIAIILYNKLNPRILKSLYL
jgi:fucose 4-O-acetylase-like acetyltransferase